ncbi:hypothetical protein CHS0354_033524 [Potamilus streckersoni]|uniref:VWFA domain-containing protein n=1 Tax=Potamilus streckersoni TaxID=2493646 RepID=A0AAE0VQR3_9BIVA|nr:hypothetical protein CHS0354_033524 [Potamilus streckersoni]
MKNVIFVLLMSYSTRVFSKLELINNGYEGLFVVIGSEVQENYILVRKIKDIITNASRLLFSATKHRAYIRNVTIIVPQTWSRSLEGNVISKPSSLDSEYILIDIPSSKYGRDPYVEGVVECGKPGKYMHLTPGLLLMEDAEKAYGPWAHMFVHEWGHLRWGLFDEYKRTVNYFNPYFYLDMETEQYEPVVCMKNIKGKALINCNKDKPCDVTKIKYPLPHDCRYCPDGDQTTPVSLMGHSYIASVTNFCENDNDTAKEYRHITTIPSDQNINCHHKSTWEVIREHADFQGKNYATSDSTDTTPIFNIAYSGPKVRAFVLDVSGSMNRIVSSSGLSRIEEMRQALKYIIDVLLQASSYLGIVSFSNSATTLTPLREIKNDTDRHILQNITSSLFASGGTGIGQGLLNAKLLFESSGMSTRESEIILLTDGEENIPPYIANVTDALIEAGIVVHTISITEDAQKNLKDLAQATGGTFLTFLEEQSVSFIDVLSQVIISSDATPDTNTPETIASHSKNTLANENYTETFKVDNGLGKDTKLTVRSAAPSSSPVLLTVVCPDGISIQNTVTSTGTQSLLCGNNKASTMPGTYTYTLSSPEATSYNVYVTSSPRGSNAEVVRVRSWLSDTEIDFASASTIRLYADVEKGRSPVLNAKVSGMLIRGDGSAINLGLHDNGKGADLYEDDGLYTTYLYKNYFTSDGRYNMKITVSGDEGTVTYSSASGQRAPPLPGVEEAQLVMESVQEFMRSIIPNEFMVKNYSSSDLDTSPPDAITDLRIANATAYAVLLEFTAPGDDFDMGQARYYEVRTSNSIHTLINDFDSSTLLDTTNIMPKPSGETEQLVFEGSVPGSSKNEEIWYVGIRAVDGDDNKGKVSNILTLGRAASFNVTDNLTVMAIADPDIDKHLEDEVNTSNTTIYIVVGVVGVAILFLVVGGLFLYRKLKKSGRNEMISNEGTCLTPVPFTHEVDVTSRVEETIMCARPSLAGEEETNPFLVKGP